MEWPLVNIFCLHIFLALSCVYSGMKFAELYSEGDSFGDFEITTDVSSYLDQSYTWLGFLFVSGIVLLIVLVLLCWLRTRITIGTIHKPRRQFLGIFDPFLLSWTLLLEVVFF